MLMLVDCLGFPYSVRQTNLSQFAYVVLSPFNCQISSVVSRGIPVISLSPFRSKKTEPFSRGHPCPQAFCCRTWSLWYYCSFGARLTGLIYLSVWSISRNTLPGQQRSAPHWPHLDCTRMTQTGISSPALRKCIAHEGIVSSSIARSISLYVFSACWSS